MSKIALLKKTLLFCQSQRVISTSLFRCEKAPSEGEPKIPKKDFKDFRKTPIGKLDEIQGQHPYAEKEPLPEWPDGVNPHTGEIGGPKGVEPTRYGDWERKGRVTDF